jgi:hypothetical protein
MLALGAACAFGGLAAATAACAQDHSAGQDLALRSAEMAAEADIEVTVADAFSPGPAGPPAARSSAAPAPRPTFRNPWTTPRPTLREAFSNMTAAFRADFQQTVPPPRDLAETAEPEPAFARAADIDFTVADAFDAQRPAAPAASSRGVAASARVGGADDGIARARALNLEAAERNKAAAGAIDAYQAAQRGYEEELARWREQLDR